MEQCLLFSSGVSNTLNINQFLACRYCEGGELFNYIIEKRYLSENVAAHIMR